MLAGDQSAQSGRRRAANDMGAPGSATGTLAEVVGLAESLPSDDQLRLITRLWGSLPCRHRAAVIRFGLENLKPENLNSAIDDKVAPSVTQPADARWSDISGFLFGPTNSSELYSAPRRFDLATIFVATGAYSVLFGFMSALSYKYLGPVTEIAVGVLVTIVGIAQAFYKDVANPRGVSVLTGAVTQTIMLVVIRMAKPDVYGLPMGFVVVFFGVLGGALSGYLAGVLVGGVFLVADVLRKKFSRRDAASAGGEDESRDASTDGGESPWAN